MIKGTDLAYCNPSVSYAAMRDAGIRFACIKLGQGRQARDVKANDHRAGCINVGVGYDWYWFCDYRDSGISNATQFIAKANGDWGMKHVCCDLEFRAIWGYPDGAHMRRFFLDFADYFEDQTGIICYGYFNRDLISQMTYNLTGAELQRLLRHPLWIASDIDNPNPTPWPKYTLNQYELDIKVPWCTTAVDLDDFNGTEEEFQAWIGGKPIQTIEQRLAILEREAAKVGWDLKL